MERPIKQPNKPFLVHQKYKQRLAADAAKEHPDHPPPPRRASSSAVSTAVRWTLLALATSAVLSRAVTHTSWSWGYDDLVASVLTRPSAPVTLSETELRRYDGADPTRPIYLAIDGDVYDVTAGRDSYGPGGAYHIFAARDAARAFVTGCFETHLTHDLRGLTEKELASLKHWKQFYETHAKYRKVGRVMHPPVDPATPVPAPCTPASGKVAQRDPSSSSSTTKQKGRVHDET
ncbi:hypothetical protein JCM11491_001620 [Sporobolomyces phaffii]